MKTVKNIILTLGAMCMLSSCLKDNPVDPTNYFSNFFTITGSESNPTFYCDGGGKMTLSSESLKDVKFNGYKRAFLTVSYSVDQLDKKSNIDWTLKLADVVSGQFIPSREILDMEAAESGNLTSADSLSKILTLNQPWGYKGYATMIVEGPYIIKGANGILPTMNLVYESVSENKVKCTLLYNEHKKTSGLSNGTIEALMTSFDISPLKEIVPGTDSVTFTVSCMGVKDMQFKIGRADFDHIR